MTNHKLSDTKGWWLAFPLCLIFSVHYNQAEVNISRFLFSREHGYTSYQMNMVFRFCMCTDSISRQFQESWTAYFTLHNHGFSRAGQIQLLDCTSDLALLQWAGFHEQLKAKGLKRNFHER